MQTQQDFSPSHALKKDKFLLDGTLTANAGATGTLSIDIPRNTLSIISALIKMSAGEVGPAIAGVADDTTDLITATAHGIATGTPIVLNQSTTVPAGITATTVYFARAASANTIAVHLTSAAAVAGTGTVDLTTAGTAVKVTTTTINAVYKIEVALANRNGITAIIGTQDLIAFEHVSAWAAAFIADDTRDQATLNLTPDVDNTTRYEIFAEVLQVSAK